MSAESEEDIDTHTYVVEAAQEGLRLDKALSDLCAEFSRSRLQALIDAGEVSVNGAVCVTSSRKMKVGEEISFIVPDPVAAEPVPENIPLDIVYEDEDLIVINKPAGMVVHPGAGNYTGTLVNALLYHCGDTLSGIGGVLRPGIVHRLDKETTGLMIAAKNDDAHQGLAAQLEDRSLSRKYKALILGNPMPPMGSVDQPIGRSVGNRLKMAVVRKGGRDAKTHYQVIEKYRDEFALLECMLESGRTHQIRVHMNFIKYPIIGDVLYGPQPTAVQGAMKRAGYDEKSIEGVLAFSRQALHAYAISFIHPISGEECEFEADLPKDFTKLLKLLDK